MRVLVTGGTSFLGAALVRRLLEGGHCVRVLSRDGTKGRRLAGQMCAVSHGDVRDTRAVTNAASGCDIVVHAAYAPVSAPVQDILDVAVTGMAVVLDACEQQGVRDLMLVSSSRAAARADSLDPASAYGTGKLAAEAMAAARSREHFRRMIIVRPYNVYGPDGGYDHVIPQFVTRILGLIRTGRPDPLPFPVRGTGCDTRSFIYADDCAEQLCVLLEGAGPGASRYDAGSAETYQTAAVARLTARCLGREIEVVPESPSAGSSIQVPALCGLLSGVPQVSFADGLARTVAWYRQHEEEVTGDGAGQV